MQHLCTAATYSLKDYMLHSEWNADHIQEVLYIAT